MNKIKRFIIMVMVIAITVSMVSGMTLKTASAADYASASNLVLSGSWSEDRWITEESGAHWYRLVIPSDGKVDFRVMLYMASSGYELYSEDLSKRLYYNDQYSGNEMQPTTLTANFILSAGTYYLNIYGIGKYKIYASFISYGANDGASVSYDSPQTYSLGSQVTGAITVTDEEDWYKIIIPSTAYYATNLCTYMWSSRLFIYNSDLSKEIYCSDYVSGDESSPKVINCNKLFEQGIYYVKISGYYTQGKYTFKMSPLNQSNCSHDYENKYVDPTYVSKGYQLHKCKLCGYSYMDNYKDKLQLGQVGTVYCTAGRGKYNLSWYSVSNSTGYQIRYSTNKSMKKSVKTVKVRGRTNKIIKKLRHRKKYYFQVRAYKKEGNQTVYGQWSKKVRVRIK